ncbi:MAG: hypothetical protein WCS96_04710 [Victivallales bacterium]
MTQYQFPQNMFILKSESQDNRCYQYAVAELRRLLERIGLHTQIQAATGPKTGNWLLLSSTAAPPPAASPVGLKHDGFSLKISAGGVAIAALEPKGILNGVYELAERLGFLFLMPGEAGEWIPDLKGLCPALVQESVKLNPRFPHRGVFGGSTTAPFTVEEWFRFFAKLKFNATSQNEGDAFIATETGIRLEIGLHGMSELLPRKLFETRPELFRMFQPEDFSGKRTSDSNFCCNHPDSKRIVQENYRKKVKSLKGIYAVHNWADDLPAGGWCMCPLCRSYTPTDQSMISMRHFAEVIAEEKLPIRVPVIAYHDTMYPGKLVPAPKEGFLLYAPRERCYAHAINDPACAKNRFYFKALQEWMAKFAGIDDAHTFEYYFDQILFRGLYPFIPDVILGDMAAYEKAGIQTHLSLQVGGPVIAPEFNMLVFSRGHWNAKLTADGFVARIAGELAPNNPGASAAWKTYLQRRRRVFASAMRLCDHSNDIYFDYRWLPETAHPFGAKMARAYANASVDLDKAGLELMKKIGCRSGRVKTLGLREAGRAHFETSDLRVMASQQDGVNNIAKYIETASHAALRQGLKSLQKAVARLEQSRRAAEKAGLPETAYYYALNKNWLQREFTAKIKTYEKALKKNGGR